MTVEARRRTLELHPMMLREARAYVSEHHRHHRAPQGALKRFDDARAAEEKEREEL